MLLLRNSGFTAYCGDASRPELFEAAVAGYDREVLYRHAKTRHNTENYANSVHKEIALPEKLFTEDSRFAEHRPDNARDKCIMSSKHRHSQNSNFTANFLRLFA